MNKEEWKMRKRVLSKKWLEEYVQWLQTEEKSKATIEKYKRDVLAFCAYIGADEVTKERVLQYKQWLLKSDYAPSSVNSMLASLNSFLGFVGWSDFKVKSLRIQRQVYCPERKDLSKEEYIRLIQTAKECGNQRMALLIQTICSTGIRVSELQFITVEAVERGEAIVLCKGKSRKIFLVTLLRKQLLDYIQRNGIKSGAVFITNRGNPMDRTSIWREMKRLCYLASVYPEKVTPHNLRHLFAKTFYEEDKDIAKLADILGHSSINTTRIYIITTESEHRQCMEKLRLTI